MEYTKQCLESIRKYTKDVSYEIIVIDNGSDEKTICYLKEQRDIHLVLNTCNKGFAGGCNQGIIQSRGEYVLLLNNDIVVTNKWLYNMVELLKNNLEISMTGPLTNATVGKQMISVPYNTDLDKMEEFAVEISNNISRPWRTLRLVAFCLLARRILFDEIGMLDENFKVGNYEDDDFNIRALLADKKAYVCRNSFVHHFMNTSFKQRNIHRESIMQENKKYLEKKWHSMDWNHHAVYNQYMLEKIYECGGKKILHIGCGLGALEVELRDSEVDFFVTGTEEHAIRRKIANEFMDDMLTYEEFIDRKEGNNIFEVVIIECMFEKRGEVLLEEIKKFINRKTLILMRVFNAEHITTMEKLITGKIGGDLLCAVSTEFAEHHGKEITQIIEKHGYNILEEKKIKKSLSNIQKKIYERVEDLLINKEEPLIYNRIFLLTRNIEDNYETEKRTKES